MTYQARDVGFVKRDIQPLFAYSRAGYGRSTPTALPRPLDYMHREAFDVLPRVLDERSKELLREFGQLNGDDVRKDLMPL
mgnify:CR=1 FL=1